LMKSPC